MNEVDKRVVQMEFDNSKFEKNIDQTMKTLEDLNKMLQMRDASKGFDTLVGDSDKLARSMGYVGESVDEVKFKLSTLQVVGYTVLSELTKTAIKVGNKMASAVWSPIVSGGARRAQNIEAAKFQLEGLGVAWKDISEDINYGVKDTAYGLDSAARVAAQLVASNIKPGELMRDTLRGISGVAAMTNSSYDEIGSIFTTVAGNNKLMTMQLRQLSYRGLNAAATLGNYLGKTEQEIYEMVSKGKIDFETFAAAMDEAFGDHAKEANKTFSGAMSNVRAALSRVGAKFADPVYDTLRQVFVALIPVINGVNRIIDPVVDGFSNFLSLLRISTTSLLTEDFSKAIGALFLDIYSWIRPLIGALVKVGVLGRDLNGVGTGLLGVLSKLQLYGPAAEKVEHFIMGIFGVIKLIFSIIKSGIIIIKPIIEAVVFGLGKIFGISGDLGQVLWGVSNVLSVLIQKLAKFISLKIERVLGVIFGVLSRIDLNKVAKGIVVIVNILGVVTKAIILLSKVTFILIAGVISSIPLLINSLTNVFGTIGSIYDAFTSKIASIFGGKKRTAELEVNTTVNGPTAFEMLQDHILTEELLSENEATQKHIEQNEKNMNRAAESMKNFGEVSKKTAHDVQKNAQAIRSAAASASDAAKETTDTWEDLTRRVHVKNTDKKFNEEEAVSQNPLVRFFIAVRNGIIFAAASLVGAVITAVSWVADAIGKAFPALGRLGNAVMDSLADFAENFGSLESWLQGLEFLVFGTIASIVAIMMSISTLIGGAGLYMGGLGVAAALAAFESAIFSILAFLTAVALITELIDLDKFDHVLNKLYHISTGLIRWYAGLFSILEAIRLGNSIISIFNKGEVAKQIVGGGSITASPLVGIASVINSLAFGLLAVVGALIIIDKVLPDNMGALYWKAIDVIGIATIGLAAILAVIGVFAHTTQLSMSSSTGSITGFGGLRDIFGSGANPVYSHTTTSENGLGGIIGLITGVGFYIAAVTLALKVISTMKTGEILKGGAVIGGALLAIAGVIAIIGLAYKKVDKEWNKDIIDQGIDDTRQKGHGKIYTKTDTTKNSGSKHTMASSLEGVAGAISAIGGYILRITLAMKVIGKMSWKEIRKGAAVLGGALAAITILLAVLAKFTKTIDSTDIETGPAGELNRRDNTKTTTKNTKTESNMDAVANAIKSISWFLVSVTASMVILSRLSKGALTRGAVTLAVAMAIMLATITVLTLISKIQTNENNKVTDIIKSMSLLILSIAAFLVLVNASLDSDTLTTKKVVLILGTLAGIITMMAVLLGMSKGVKSISPIISIVGGIIAVLAALTAAIHIIGRSNLEQISTYFAEAILPFLISIGVVLGALLLVGNFGDLMVASIPAMIAMIAALDSFILILAGAVTLMAGADLKNLSDNIAAINELVALTAGLFGLIAIIASTGVEIPALLAASGAFAMLETFLMAVAASILIIGASDIKKLKEGMLQITGLIGLISGAFIVLTTIASTGVGGVGLVAAAGAFGIITVAVIGIATAINTLANSDVNGMRTAGDTLAKVLLSIGAAALMVGGAIAIAAGSTIGMVALIVVAIIAAVALIVWAVKDGIFGEIWDGLKKFFSWTFSKIEDLIEKLAELCGWAEPVKAVLDPIFHPVQTARDAAEAVMGMIPFGGGRSRSSSSSDEEGSTSSNNEGGRRRHNSSSDEDDEPSTHSVGGHHGPGANGVGNQQVMDIGLSQNAIMHYIAEAGNDTKVVDNVRKSGINLGNTLLSGFRSALDTGKQKIQNATNALLNFNKETEQQQKQYSNMSKVLDEYSNSITKNIVNKNREAIETTKELSNAIDNSSNSMKTFSKATGESSNLAILSKEIGAFNKESSNISYDHEKLALDGYEAGKAGRDGMIKAFSWGDVGESIMSIIGGGIEKVGDAASGIIETLTPGWLKDLTNGNLDIFGDMGFDLGSYAGMIGGEQMMEMFGIYTKEYYEKLAAQALQGITGSQRGLNEASKRRDEYVAQMSHGLAKTYDELESLIAAHPEVSMFQAARAAVDAKYGTTVANYQAQVATQRGAYEAAMKMADATTYPELDLGDIGDLFNNLPTGTPSDYTSDAASAIANSSGSGSGINDSSIGGPGSTNINSNNTYNFTQNNYSPEALSRSDLYMQTRAQINAWYGWMRGQPAT